MAWIILLLIISIGLGLIVIEIIFVPGTTVVGIAGLLCVIGGVWFGFSEFGKPMGWTITAVTVLVSTAVIIVSLKSGVWKRFALNKSMDSKVNEHIPISVNTGDEGIALSALRPIGNAEFGNDKMEVTTLGELIDTGSKVKVTHIEGRIIYVEQLNN
jgi:membrane-bound ClpP family serine protease